MGVTDKVQNSLIIHAHYDFASFILLIDHETRITCAFIFTQGFKN